MLKTINFFSNHTIFFACAMLLAHSTLCTPISSYSSWKNRTHIQSTLPILNSHIPIHEEDISHQWNQEEQRYQKYLKKRPLKGSPASLKFLAAQKIITEKNYCLDDYSKNNTIPAELTEYLTTLGSYKNTLHSLQNFYCNPLLFQAVNDKNAPLITDLYNLGSYFSITSSSGKPLLIHAIEIAKEDTGIVSLLIKYSADIKAKYNGKTAVDFAREKKYDSIVALLTSLSLTKEESS